MSLNVSVLSPEVLDFAQDDPSTLYEAFTEYNNSIGEYLYGHLMWAPSIQVHKGNPLVSRVVLNDGRYCDFIFNVDLSAREGQ